VSIEGQHRADIIEYKGSTVVCYLDWYQGPPSITRRPSFQNMMLRTRIKPPQSAPARKLAETFIWRDVDMTLLSAWKGLEGSREACMQSVEPRARRNTSVTWNERVHEERNMGRSPRRSHKTQELSALKNQAAASGFAR
jgi:hypothetical protein